MLVPRQPVPALTVETLENGSFDLAQDGAEFATLVVFYRGLHCPICATYLKELGRLTEEFAAKGVKTIAISSDDQDRAQKMADKVAQPGLRFGYGLPLSVARDWGLFISTSRGTTSDRHRGAGAVFRTGRLPGETGRHALFRVRTNDALRASALPGNGRRARFRAEKRLSGPRRIYRRGLERVAFNGIQ